MKTLARLLVVLLTVWGVPHAAQNTLRLTAPDAIHLPVGAAVSRADARAGIAAAWRSLQTHPGIAPGGVAAPPLALSGILAPAFTASVARLSFPSSPVRGPPSVI